MSNIYSVAEFDRDNFMTLKRTREYMLVLSRLVYGQIITQQCPWRNAPTYLPEATCNRRKANILSPLKEGSSSYHSNVTWTAPFPSLGSVWIAEMPKMTRPTSFGPPIIAEMLANCRPILTRGQTEFAEMPFIERLATKEIQYGYKI